MKHTIKQTFAAALITAAALLSGCSGDRLSPLSEEATILAFGDSLTQGVGVTLDNSYPAVLAELSGRKVINAGISGELTKEGLARFASAVEEAQPALIVLLEGGNDILRKQSMSYTKDNLSQMIEYAQSQEIDVVLIGVPEKKLTSDSAPLYYELAEQYGLVFSDEIISDLIINPFYKSDPVHFNDKGYRKLAEHVYELLGDNGAI